MLIVACEYSKSAVKVTLVTGDITGNTTWKHDHTIVCYVSHSTFPCWIHKNTQTTAIWQRLAWM